MLAPLTEAHSYQTGTDLSLSLHIKYEFFWYQKVICWPTRDSKMSTGIVAVIKWAVFIMEIVNARLLGLGSGMSRMARNGAIP